MLRSPFMSDRDMLRSPFMGDRGQEARSLGDYFSILRRRWLSIVAMLVVTVAAAATLTFTQVPVYRSSMKIVVGQGEGVFRAEFGSAADEFTQTMSDLFQSDIVASTVVDNLELDATSSELIEDLHVETKPSSAVLDVSFDATNREHGRVILQEFGDVFTDLVSERLATSTAGTGGSEITASIFDPAHYVADLVSPRRLLNLAVASALGLVLGLLLGLTREHFDDRLRGVDRIEAAFGQGNSSTLPPRYLGHRPIASSHAKALGWSGRRRVDPVLAELMTDRLRSDLLWPWEEGENKTIVVTSARPEEGKTAIVVNLSVAVARAGHDVILVEADLRRPRIREYLKLPARSSVPSLDMVLSGSRSLEEALVPIPLFSADVSKSETPGVSLTRTSRGRIGVGQGSLNAIVALPGQVSGMDFSAQDVAELLDKLHEKAPIVIVDTPPLLSVTDAYPFIASADTVVAAFRNGRSTSSSTQELRRVFARLGVTDRVRTVVTEVDPPFDVAYGYVSTPAGRSKRADPVTPFSSGLMRVGRASKPEPGRNSKVSTTKSSSSEDSELPDVETGAPVSE